MARDETVRVSVEHLLDQTEAEGFWPVYEAAFGHLRTRAAARQVLHEAEFFEEMHDPRVAKYVARASDGGAVGLTTLALSLAVVPWISPEYYAERYPENASRGAIYYVGFSLAHPNRKSVTAFPLMLNAMMERCAADRAVCLWDICGHNNDALNFADSIGQHLRRHTGLVVEPLDTQTYYGVRFP